MKYTLQQISNIITKRPNKKRILYAQKLNKRLMLQLHGVGIDSAFKKKDYFESDEICNARKADAISNIDLYARLLQEEEQIFTTRGGSSYFNLPEQEEAQMNTLLSDVIYGLSLQKWMQTFGIRAYRADPMGVIFFEVQKVTTIEGVDNEEAGLPVEYNIETPKCYPTYICSQDIWEMQNNGRKLDYLCLALTADELEMYGITEKDPQIIAGKEPIQKTYFRWIDDGQDVVVKLQVNGGNFTEILNQIQNNTVVVADLNGVPNPIEGLWNRVPGFIVSDLMKFTDAGCFDTPLMPIVELAEQFMQDRSVRDLQKKYHGFAKAFEPLSMCPTCMGTKFTKGVPCIDCTIAGQSEGTGYKLRTKISDVFKFPLSILNKDQAPHFDAKAIFGYVQTPVETWQQQDLSLDKLEESINITYWTQNKNQISGFNGKQSQPDTALKTLTDQQGKEARLNKTADWLEQTIRMAANLIGEFWFDESFKGSQITIGRNYVLENANTVLEVYHDKKANGDSDSLLDYEYEKYLNTIWQSNPNQKGIYQKKFDVEPFPHASPEEVEASSYVLEIDKVCKRYFSEWDDTITDPQWADWDIEKLRKSLLDYATLKSTAITAEQDLKAKKQLALQTPVMN